MKRCKKCKKLTFKDHCFECDRGIPYSVNEAKEIVRNKKHRIDEYHREMIEWLLWKIECLEKGEK